MGDWAFNRAERFYESRLPEDRFDVFACDDEDPDDARDRLMDMDEDD